MVLNGGGGVVRVTEMSHTPFWGDQIAFVKHFLEGGKIFVSCTGIFWVFF